MSDEVVLERQRWWEPVAVVMVGLVLAWRYGTRLSAPSEDATMLFRYAENVARGWGVVWNRGGPRTDGATDLLFMFVLAGLHRLGLGVERAAALVNIAGFLGVALVVQRVARTRGAGPSVGLAAAGVVLLAPGLGYIQVGFAATTFGLTIALVAWGALRAVDGAPAAFGWWWGVAIVVAGLVRPEGFLLGAVVAGAALVGGGGVARPVVTRALAVAIGGGVAFVAVRWWYFGYPLPNPYYRKGGGRLYPATLWSSVVFAGVTPAFWPPLAVLVVASFRDGLRRLALSGLAGVGGSGAIWLLVSNEMNFKYRFQFPMLVVAFVFGAALVGRVLPPAPPVERVRDLLPRIMAFGLTFLLLFAAFVYESGAPRDGEVKERVAAVLANHQRPGRTIVTTEAGFICWRSGWRCIDAWGLNDQSIAHDGFLDDRQLVALGPDVVFLHAPTNPLADAVDAGSAAFLPGWSDMTTALIRFAETHDYALAVTFPTAAPASLAAYVRTDAPDARSLIADLQALRGGGFDPSMLVDHLPTATR